MARTTPLGGSQERIAKRARHQDIGIENDPACPA
jgi:hypothetical protein